MSKKHQQKKKGKGAGASVGASQKQASPASPAQAAQQSAAPAPAPATEQATTLHQADHGHAQGHHHTPAAPSANTLLGQYGLMLTVFASFLVVSLLPFLFVSSLRSDAYVVVFVGLVTFGFVVAACALDWAGERISSKH